VKASLPGESNNVGIYGGGELEVYVFADVDPLEGPRQQQVTPHRI